MSILIALALSFLVVGAAQWGFDYRLPGPVVIVLYFLSYLLVERLRRAPVDPRHAAEPDPDWSHWPTSGPIGRFGQGGLQVPWTITNALAIFNPFQAVQVFRQIAGNARLEARARASGDDGTRYRPRVCYRLPFDGEWVVYNGGMTPKTSHSWDVLGQRFALDFVRADAGMRRHTGRGTRADEYLCHGQDILAAADGEVVAVVDGIRQAPLLGWGVCDFTARHFAGNHVLVRHAEGEYGLYAHLIAGSIAVRIGEQVRSGQRLGRCGHTGHTSEPHLHFHLQDSADLYQGMGLPVRFSRVSVDGRIVDEAWLTAGNRVHNA